MKSFCKKILRPWFLKLYPEYNSIPISQSLKIEKYETKELASSYVISEQEIRTTQLMYLHDNMNVSQAIDHCTEIAKKRIKDALFLAIEQNELIEFHREQINCCKFQVVGRLKVGMKYS